MNFGILPSLEGDPFTLDGRRGSVAVACECPAKSYACVSCNQLLANAYQLELHTERGSHVIAKICGEHGVVATAAPTGGGVRDAAAGQGLLQNRDPGHRSGAREIRHGSRLPADRAPRRDDADELGSVGGLSAEARAGRSCARLSRTDGGGE